MTHSERLQLRLQRQYVRVRFWSETLARRRGPAAHGHVHGQPRGSDLAS